MNKSAASAASLDSVKFQAVIKSAASAASRKPKSRGSSRGVQDDGFGWRATASGHSPGASFPGFGLPGGCASSRLDHGCKIPPGEAALAADFDDSDD